MWCSHETRNHQYRHTHTLSRVLARHPLHLLAVEISSSCCSPLAIGKIEALKLGVKLSLRFELHTAIVRFVSTHDKCVSGSLFSPSTSIPPATRS